MPKRTKKRSRTDSKVQLQEQVEAMRKKGYITLAEAARRLLVHHFVISRAANEGRIESVQVGNKKYLKFDSFKEYAGPLAGTINKVGPADDGEDER